MPAGYSGTPLARKLSLVDGVRIFLHEMPDPVRRALADVGWIEVPSADRPEAAHLFVTEQAVLEPLLADLRQRIVPNGFVWVSWPKKASRVPTDLTEDTIRAVALPMGWVDVKVCAVDEVWSGLKLMIRRELR